MSTGTPLFTANVGSLVSKYLAYQPAAAMANYQMKTGNSYSNLSNAYTPTTTTAASTDSMTQMMSMMSGLMGTSQTPAISAEEQQALLEKQQLAQEKQQIFSNHNILINEIAKLEAKLALKDQENKNAVEEENNTTVIKSEDQIKLDSLYEKLKSSRENVAKVETSFTEKSLEESDSEHIETYKQNYIEQTIAKQKYEEELLLRQQQSELQMQQFMAKLQEKQTIERENNYNIEGLLADELGLDQENIDDISLIRNLLADGTIDQSMIRNLLGDIEDEDSMRNSTEYDREESYENELLRELLQRNESGSYYNNYNKYSSNYGSQYNNYNTYSSNYGSQYNNYNTDSSNYGSYTGSHSVLLNLLTAPKTNVTSNYFASPLTYANTNSLSAVSSLAPTSLRALGLI